LNENKVVVNEEVTPKMLVDDGGKNKLVANTSA
jgi:hypothetical protein